MRFYIITEQPFFWMPFLLKSCQCKTFVFLSICIEMPLTTRLGEVSCSVGPPQNRTLKFWQPILNQASFLLQSSWAFRHFMQSCGSSATDRALMTTYGIRFMHYGLQLKMILKGRFLIQLKT